MAIDIDWRVLAVQLTLKLCLENTLQTAYARCMRAQFELHGYFMVAHASSTLQIRRDVYITSVGVRFKSGLGQQSSTMISTYPFWCGA